MKKPLPQLIVMFLVALTVFMLYSLVGKEVKFPMLIKQNEMAGVFESPFVPRITPPAPIAAGDTVVKTVRLVVDTVYEDADPNHPRVVVRDSIVSWDTLSVEAYLERMDTTSQRILLIGDSMVEGLMWRFKDYAEFNGHDLKPVIWYSSSTFWYGTHDTLRYFIRTYNPTYVILVIGANELFISDIIEKRDGYTKNVIAQIGNRRFIWVGPPNWKEDTGINEMILNNVGSGRYFESKRLKFQRARDGAHPTRASAAVWADSICSWIMTRSKYPIRLNKPDLKAKGTPKATLIQPLK